MSKDLRKTHKDKSSAMMKKWWRWHKFIIQENKSFKFLMNLKMSSIVIQLIKLTTNINPWPHQQSS